MLKNINKRLDDLHKRVCDLENLELAKENEKKKKQEEKKALFKEVLHKVLVVVEVCPFINKGIFYSWSEDKDFIKDVLKTAEEDELIKCWGLSGYTLTVKGLQKLLDKNPNKFLSLYSIEKLLPLVPSHTRV